MIRKNDQSIGSVLRKAVDRALREVRLAPEQIQARVLRSRSSASEHLTSDPLKVMFLVPRSWATDVQWSTLMARGMEYNGHDVTVITCGGNLPICGRVSIDARNPTPCHTCRGYTDPSVKAHGFRPTTIKSRRSSHADVQRSWKDLDKMSLEEMRHLTWNDIPLGRLVDVPVKWYLRGGTIREDPAERRVRGDFLIAAREIAIGFEKILAEQQPDRLVLVNGYFLFEAIAKFLAERKHIDVVSYERGFRAETLFMRRGLEAATYNIDEIWSDHGAEPLSSAANMKLDNLLHDRRMGRGMQVRYAGSDAPLIDGLIESRPGKCAVAFTNITWDSAVLNRELIFDDILDWILETISIFRSRPDDSLIVRIHPAEVKLPGIATRERLKPLLMSSIDDMPNNVIIYDATDDIDSYKLMELADMGLVYTSTTGLEMALTGKPVVVAAQTHYRGKGFTIDPPTRRAYAEDLLKLLDESENFNVQYELARRYAYLFFFKAQIGSSFVREPVRGLARLGELDPMAMFAPGSAVDRICEFITSDEPVLFNHDG